MKEQVLAIGTHPDDIEIGCGGTLALLKERGCKISNIIVTSGEEGGLQISKSELSKTREQEAIQSGIILGSDDIQFLREPDGLTSFSKETKIRLISFLRQIRPSIIFVHAPSDQFPDHKIVHQLSMSAIQAAQGPWYPEALGDPHRVQSIYGFEVWNPIQAPQLYSDITSVIHRKIEVLRLHKSQMEDINYIEAVMGLARYRGALSMSGEYAEAFEVLKSTL
jgi:LmbE family N-acetylglucosaminyl deacetylase